MTYEKPYPVQYHVFADNVDEYVGTAEEAIFILEKLLATDEGDYQHKNIRIYRDTVWNENEGMFEDGESIFSLGEFPH